MAFRIESRVGVACPPEVVWRILSDLEGWGDWTGLYRNVQGRLRIDEEIQLELHLPGEKPERLSARILDWAPELQIHWRVSLMGGLLTTTRYLEIEKLSEEGCIFSNGEIFRGVFSRYMPARLRRAIRAGFEAMSEELKTRAEAAWREPAPAPTSPA